MQPLGVRAACVRAFVLVAAGARLAAVMACRDRARDVAKVQLDLVAIFHKIFAILFYRCKFRAGCMPFLPFDVAGQRIFITSVKSELQFTMW
jgi:hypothetical protein